MHAIAFVLFGLLVAIATRVALPGRGPDGWAASIALGVLGSCIGGSMASLLGVFGEGQMTGFLMCMGGATLLLLGYRVYSNRTEAS